MEIFLLRTMVAATMLSMHATTATPLDDYIQKPDPFYKWKVLDWQYRGPDFKLYAINMTSQKWLTAADTSQPIWWHLLYIAIPDVISRPDGALMYISCGFLYDDYVPNLNDEQMSFITAMSVSTGTVTAVLRQVPNQPLVFENDPDHRNRSECAAMSWTWNQFVFRNASAKWLLQLPMAKAAVRAMDTISAFTKQKRPYVNVRKFLLCGRSKRGWTSLTVGSVDHRVVAIVPIVFDLLNLVQNLHHHYRSLGGWTFAFDEYHRANITRGLDNPRTQRMADIIDPFAYRKRLTMPKYFITTGGDEFFLPDDSYYYLSQMHGETYLRTIPNSGHNVTFQQQTIYLGVRAFYLSVLDELSRPHMTWTKNFTATGGTLTLHIDRIPEEVNVYYAQTLDGIRRDFRAHVLDPNSPPFSIPHPVYWYQGTVQVKSPKKYSASFDNPATGWLVFHIQARFAGPDGSHFDFTTENMIIPDCLPFSWCAGEECYGTLV